MKLHKINAVEIIEVIRVSITAGTGKDASDVLRPAFQYWSLKGEMLAEVDEYGAPLPSQQQD